MYLALGFFLKCLYFFLKMPGRFYLSLIYLTSYFVVHDLVQIRVGAALGLALWAVHYLGARNTLIASVLWRASFFFTLASRFSPFCLFLYKRIIISNLATLLAPRSLHMLLRSRWFLCTFCIAGCFSRL